MANVSGKLLMALTSARILLSIEEVPPGAELFLLVRQDQVPHKRPALPTSAQSFSPAAAPAIW